MSSRESTAFDLLKRLINDQNNPSIIIEGLNYYYSNIDTTLKTEAFENIEKMDIQEQKELLRQLCGEAINRDFILYITSGVYGNHQNNLVNILKNKIK